MNGAPPLKPLHFSVLLVLAEQEDYGYGIVKRIATSEAGGILIAPSNLYHVLDQLMEMGLIRTSPRTDRDAPRRSYFQITPRGLGVARSEAKRLAAVVETAQRLKMLGEGEA